MKVTPLEIRQKVFEKKIRGYDKDEVNAFLLSLSQEWERMLDESKERHIKLENAEKEVVKLREVESSLFKTLKTAEDTGANMIEQANKTAELHLRETQISADSLLNEAKNKAKRIIEEAEENAKRTLHQMESQLKDLQVVYKELMELRDHLTAELKHLATSSIDKADRINQKTAGHNVDELLQKARTALDGKTKSPLSKAFDSESQVKGNISSEEKPVKAKKDKSGSFFDEIG